MIIVPPMLWKPPTAAGNPSLLSAITTAALTSNLKLCLDAGDSASYSSGQPWLDRSGGGYDFNRGATSSSEASDPTFNGTQGGLSSNEYWSFDGGDYFTYDSANETWMNALHKDGAAFSCIAAVFIPSGATTTYIFGTNAGSSANIGVAWRLSTTNAPVILVSNGSSNILAKTATAMSFAAWHIVGFSIDETGASGFHYLDGAYNQVSSSDTFDATYALPSVSDASFVPQIGAAGNNGGPLKSTSRVGWFGMWQGVALSKANFDTLYAALKGRYGLA